jgi:MFS family permease
VGFFMLAFHSAISSSLMNWVYGSFQSAPQISTSYILASIIGGVLKLPLAKTLQLWGRAEALLFSTAIYIVGMIILAACNGPNAFAAGYVLYWIGYYCIYLILDIFVADTTGLRSRAFAFAFASTPFICTAFTGSLAAQSIYNTSGWRWGYGMFCIIQPVVFCPLALLFKFYERKAIKMGVWQPRNSGRTKMQSIIHYFHEFDGKRLNRPLLFSVCLPCINFQIQSLVPSCLWLLGSSSCCPSAWPSMAALSISQPPSSQWLLSASACSSSLLRGRNGSPAITSFAMNC